MPWLVAGTISVGLILGTWWASALAFFGLLVLALLAAVPWLGSRVLVRIGWRSLPAVGALSGLKASGALATAAAVILVLGATVAPKPPQDLSTPDGAAAVARNEPLARGGAATASSAIASVAPTNSSSASSAPTSLNTPEPTAAATATAAPTAKATVSVVTAAPAFAPAATTQTPAPTTQSSTPTQAPATAPPFTSAPAATTASPVASNLVITRLNYDGVVASTEADEFVEITNRGGLAQNMSGWSIVSVRAGQTYRFANVAIAAGQTCRVYTNESHPEWCGFNWGVRSAVWNNAGDRANLVNPLGQVISTVGYKGY
jgi:hypothetical protein